MTTTQTFLDNLWRWKCGLPEEAPKRAPKYTLKEIEKLQWSEKFIKLMKNRMLLGFFRYGPVMNNSVKYDNINSAIRRLKNYQKTGNQEFLVDAANLMMVECMQENHPNTHFESIDDGEHTNSI